MPTRQEQIAEEIFKRERKASVQAELQRRGAASTLESSQQEVQPAQPQSNQQAMTQAQSNALGGLPIGSDLPPFTSDGEPILEVPRKENKPFTIAEKLIGGAETALTLGVGATVGSVAGVVGFGKGIVDSFLNNTFGTPEGAKNVENEFISFMNSVTPVPNTDAGMEFLKNTAELLELATPFGGFSQLGSLGTTLKPSANQILTPAINRLARNPPVKPDRSNLTAVREVQNLLSENGSSLSAYQTGQASRIRAFSERMGDIGIFSSGRSVNRNKANSAIISNEIQKMVDGLDPNLIKSEGDLGKTMFGLIQTAKKSAGELYGKDLTEIGARFGNEKIKTGPIVSKLSAYLKSNTNDSGSTLNTATLSVINETINRLNVKPATQPKGLNAFSVGGRSANTGFEPTVSVSTLMGEEKLFNSKVTEKGQFGAEGFNGIAEKELAEVSKILRDTINSEYTNQGFPNLASIHSKAKSAYGGSLGNLIPKVNERMIEGISSPENANVIGRLLIGAKDAKEINGFMKSIDEAHAIATRKGDKLTLSADETKRAIRQSYLSNIFSEISDNPDAIFASKFKRLSKDLKNKSKRENMQAVLREDFIPYTKLVSALEIAGAEQKSNALGFIIRGKQVGDAMSLGNLVAVTASGAAGAGLGGGLGSIAAVTSVLAIPSVLGVIASNKGAVARLLKFNEFDLSDPTLNPRLAAVSVNAILDELPDSDRVRIKKLVKEAQQEIDNNE